MSTPTAIAEIVTEVLEPVRRLERETLTWPERATQAAESLSLPDGAAYLAVLALKDAYDVCAGLRRGVRALADEVANTFDPIVSKANAAHKEACAQRARVAAPLQQAAEILARALARWEDAEVHARRHEEALRQAAAVAAEEEQRLAEALELEAAGDGDGAAVVLETPAPLPAVALEKPTAPATSSRITYSAVVTDKLALIKHVAQHPELARLLEPSMPNLNAQARSLGAALALPGVRAQATRTIVQRR